MTTSRRLAPLPLLLIGLAALAALVFIPWVVHAQTSNQDATGRPPPTKGRRLPQSLALGSSRWPRPHSLPASAGPWTCVLLVADARKRTWRVRPVAHMAAEEGPQRSSPQGRSHIAAAGHAKDFRV